MLFSLSIRVFLFISSFITGNSPKICPHWVASLLNSTLSEHPEWPGIQLTLSSPRCNLDCTASIQSTLSRFDDEPALFDNTPWRLASVTKTMTAVAILKLVEQAHLDLDAPAIQHLPGWAIDELRRSQGDVHAGQITIWHLLHHTSGLGNFANDPHWMEEVLQEPKHTWTPRSLIKWSTANSTAVGYPGQVFHYSDTGYTLLGLILENVTRTDLAATVRNLTHLDELEMKSTWWELLESGPRDSRKRAGQYYNSVDVTHFNPTFDLFGAGGLVTNSRDLNRFGRALYQGRLLNETSMQLLYTLESSGTYGCGILHYSFASQQAWGHTGFWNTWLYWIPSLDLVVSGASNQGGGESFNAEKLIQLVIDHGCTPK